MDGTATWAYRDRFADAFARTYFRRFADGVVSSIGVGTYLGDATDAADDRYRAALVEALETGINVLDTAVNYRYGRSERVVGEALAGADVDTDAVLVATKGGFVAFDGERPPDPAAYVADRYGDLGDLQLVRGNCIDPPFLARQLDRSRERLGVDPGLYYLHNPETQLESRSREAVYDAIEDAFAFLERRVAAGDVGGYGVATWDCFRVPRDHPRYLSLAEVIRRARAASDRAGTEGTGFRAIQLPFSVEMADAFTVEAHEGPGPDGPRSALSFAHDAGLAVFASAPLLQGDLAEAGAIPDAVAERLAGDTPAQRAINFARSAPGVTAALVGTGSPDHVAENVAAGTFPPLGAAAFDATFE
jgi:aryl-alcohol dehydrogenase-like predicted oxidoreductase